MTEVTTPVQYPTSMCFGGKGYETMYITTAGMDTFTPQTYPAGYLFKTTFTGVRGTEMFKFTTA